ncbi:ECF transporter S component [Oscillospiraceae bacterium WX1]
MKFTTKKLVIMAVFIALSIALVSIIHFPIFPAAPYLEYDPADIPILIGGFAFGPLVGIMITIVASAIQALTVSVAGGPFGFVMHVLATSTLVTVSSVIYRMKHTRLGAIIGLTAGTVAMALIMVVANHFLTPLFFPSVSAADIDAGLFVTVLPFNLIKAGGNSIITFIVYKSVSKYIIHNEKLGGRTN